jgi:hypothetical protein
MVHHFDYLITQKATPHFVLDAVILEITIYLTLLFLMTLCNMDNDVYLDAIGIHY